MIIKKENYKTTPWLNGQGTTQQLFIQPLNSQLKLQNFKLRISIATLTKTHTAFSKFQQYHRYLALLQGGPLHLQNKIAQKQLTIYPKKQILSFKGEESWQCQAQSEGRDFNFFVKKGTDSFMNFESFQDEKNFALNKGNHFLYICSQKQLLVSFYDKQFLISKSDLFYLNANQNVDLKVKGEKIQFFHCYAQHQ